MILHPGHIRNSIKPEIKFICGFIAPLNNWSQDEFNSRIVKQHADELLATLKRHCLYPSFCKSLQGFELPHTIEWDSFGSGLKKTMQHNAAQILKKTSILIKIQTEFRNNGIPVIFLKGPALSQRLFGDVAMRYSWDLDILVQAHNLGKAIELLVNSGYSGDLNSSLTKKQLAYCLINFQHFTFYNTEENSCIELHWHITSLDLLTSINTDTLFLNTEQLIIAGKPIIVLKPEYELTYLISHAAFHAFHRLQWLYDIKLYFEQPAFNKNTMNEFAANWGFTELFSLTGYLLNLYFGDINTSIPTIRKRFIKLCIYLVNRSSPELKRQYGMGDHLGRLLILDSWVKRWDLLHAVFTSPKDWKEIKLPDSLFVIYYLLRPWFVIKRLIKIKAMI